MVLTPIARQMTEISKDDKYNFIYKKKNKIKDQ